MNNTIMCKILRDGKLYEKSVDLTFGAHGTNGTEYSLIVRLGDEYWKDPNPPLDAADNPPLLIEKDVPAWTSGHDKNSYITLFAQLYDERNSALPETEVTYTWDVEQFTGNLSHANIFTVETVTISEDPKKYEYRLQIKSDRRAKNSITEDD